MEGNTIFNCSFPEFLLVYDPSKGEAVPVQFSMRTDEKYSTSIDATATAATTVTTTVRNNVVFNNIGNNCDVEVVLGFCHEIMTAVTVADASRIARSTWRLQIDRDDCAWVDDASVQTCLSTPIHLAGLATGNNIVGRPYDPYLGMIGRAAACEMRPFVATNETVILYSVTNPSGAAAVWDWVTWVVKARYTTAPRANACVLQPAIYGGTPGNPQVYTVGRAPLLVAPPQFQSAPAAATAMSEYGVGSYEGVPQAGIAPEGLYR